MAKNEKTKTREQALEQAATALLKAWGDGFAIGEEMSDLRRALHSSPPPPASTVPKGGSIQDPMCRCGSVRSEHVNNAEFLLHHARPDEPVTCSASKMTAQYERLRAKLPDLAPVRFLSCDSCDAVKPESELEHDSASGINVCKSGKHEPTPSPSPVPAARAEEAAKAMRERCAQVAQERAHELAARFVKMDTDPEHHDTESCQRVYAATKVARDIEQRIRALPTTEGA